MGQPEGRGEVTEEHETTRREGRLQRNMGQPKGRGEVTEEHGTT